MDQLNAHLWRRINEPDIDPLMADAIRLNHQFRDWWAHKFISDIRSISNAYDRMISYEEVAERAESYGLQALSEHLLAGIKRYQHTGEPRNPDDIVSSFRVQYSGLLRDEYPHLYKLLSARGKKLFDGSQKWFYFKLTNGVEIVHKISNKVNEQNENDEQYLSLHVPGMGTNITELPDLDLYGSWRPARSNSKNKSAIYDIPLSRDARMFFSSFDTGAALRVWDLVDTLRCRGESAPIMPGVRVSEIANPKQS